MEQKLGLELTGRERLAAEHGSEAGEGRGGIVGSRTSIVLSFDGRDLSLRAMRWERKPSDLIRRVLFFFP